MLRGDTRRPGRRVRVSDTELDAQTPRPDRQGARTRLLDGMPVTERRIEAAGISTPLLEGGEGPPLMLLHGQGGFAPMWGLVIPELAEGHRVLAPDLPGLGESQLTGGELDATRVVAWLGELIEQTCDEPPTVVGHSLGGTIAARLAIERRDGVRQLVLVDSGSLGRFRPAPGVIVALLRFSARPSRSSHERFLSRVFVDPDRVRAAWGERWEAFEDYHIDRAADSSVGAANRQLLRRLGVRRIPADRLDEIAAPTSLIWGREDPIMPFRIAEEVAAQLDWPLYPIDDCGHVPQAERPQALLAALDALEGAPARPRRGGSARRAELKETIRRYRDAFPDLNIVIEDMVSSGDLVTTRWRASGTHRGDLMGLGATNKRSEVTGLNLTRFLDGKVTEEWSEWNEANMLRQLGALPERESTQERALLGLSNLRTRVGGMLGGR